MKKLGTLCASIVSLLLCSISIAAPPSPPQNVQQAWLGLEALLLWDETPDATSYKIYRSDNTNTTWTLVGSSSVPRFRDAAFEFLPSFYVVTALNADGESAGSELSTVAFAEQYTVTVYEPMLWDGTLTPTNAIIQWYTSDPNGAQGIVDWGLEATNFTSFAINTNYLGSQAFNLTNLTPLTIYHYRLTSINSNRSGVIYLGSFGTLDTNHPPTADDFFMLFPAWTNGTGIPLTGHDSNFPPVMALTFRIVSQPTNGTLSAIQPGGMWNQAYVTYTPAWGARGYDHFRYVVNNGTWDSAPALVTITNWVNTKPITTNAWVSTPEDSPLALTLPYFDADGDPLTFTIMSEWRGVVTGVPPNLIFTPETNYYGSASVSYHVSDGYEGAYGWFSIDVTPVNDKAILETNGMPPIVTWEDFPVQISIWAFDIDPSWPNEFIAVTNPAHGTLTVDNWYVNYRPATNFNGTDSFSLVFREFDGTTSDPQTYFVTVHPQNDEPIGLDQNVTTLEDTALVITPMGTDVDSDPALFTFQLGWAWQGWATNGWVEQTGTNFIYHPATNFYGEDHFRFDVIDDWGYRSWSLPGTIRIQVLPVGEPPVASVTVAFAHQDAFVNGFFQVSDLDNDVLVCEVLTAPTNGTVTVNGTNFLYTPTAGYQGPDLFTYRAFDGEFYSDVTNTYIWVNGPNTTPEAIPQTEATLQDTPFTFLLYMWDNDGEPVTANLVDAPTNGTVAFNGNYATYTPAPGFYGADSFTYQPFDGVTNGNTTTITIIVSQPNQPPVANNSTASGNEDSTIGVSLSASDPEGNILTYQILSGPANGVLTGSDASRSYRPNTNFNGSDSITFRVSDGQYNSASATVTITVTAVNDAPVATNTTVLDYEEYPVTFVLGGTDVDNSITTCTFTIVTPPIHGTLSSGNRVRTYTPATNYFGPDSFTFQISDGAATSGLATVSITVNPLPDAPVAFPQTVTTAEEVAVPITLSAFDADGDTLTYQIFATPNWGTLSGTAPNLTYTPHSNLNGFDWFNFRVSDGMSNSAIVVVGINITPVNDAPVIHEQTYTFAEDVSIFGTYWASDIDTADESLNYELISGPSHGTLTPAGFGTVGWTYRPDTNYFGTDTFTYIANDGSLTSAVGRVNVVINPVNDAPIANAQSLSTPEDNALPITLTGSDVDTNALTYSVVSGPSHGALSGSAANLTYTPAANYFGSDSFTFSVSDGIASSTATVSITVTAVSDLPAPDGLHRRIYANDGIVRLWWNAVPGAQSYSVYRADTNSPFTLLASGITETNFNDTNALWQQTYWYRITAWDGTAEGAPSNPVLARRDGTGLITTYQENWLILGTTARVQFCSSLVIGTEGMWEYGTTTNYDHVLENTNLLGCHNFNLGSLLPATVYYYRLTATDSNGNAVAYWNSLTTRAAPVADPQSASMAEDSTRDFTLTGHISPAAGYYYAPPITYAIVSGPAHGTLTFLSGTTYRYRPATNYNGPDSFTFKVNDTDLDSAPATVSITVTPVNDPPVITVPTPSANWQITAGTVTPQWSTVVPVNARFYYGPFTGPVWSVPSPNYGTQHSLTISGLVPGRDYYYGISVWTTSGDTNWVSGGFQTLTNHAPTASNQTVYANWNLATNIYPTVSDADGHALNFNIVASPTNGIFSATGSNWFRYLPAMNFSGVDGFAYRVDDGFATSQVATVTIYVFPPNGAPIALPYSTNTVEDVTVKVPFRGVDAQSNVLSYSIVGSPSHGTLTLTPTNATYRPATNYNGTDSFTYRAFDGASFSAPANVSLTVTPVNDRPIANNQNVTVTEDVAQPITLTGSDVDFNSLTYTVATGPMHGTLSGSGNSRTYTPASNYNGTDSFTFFVNDGLTNSATATVSINVTAVNDVPNALPQSLSLGEDTEITFSVNGSDADGDALSVEVISAPTNGTLNIAGTNYTYRPMTNFYGDDGLTFRVFDGTVWSAPATISITVTSVIDGPIAYAQAVALAEDGSRAIVLTGFDGDGETLAYSIVSSPSHGTLSGTPPNVTYQPDANFNGTDSFTFQVAGGAEFSAPAAVSITVSPVNDSPVVTNRNFAATEDTALNFTLNGSDADGDALTFSISAMPLHGTISGTGPSFTYTAATNYSGTDSFDYTANDGTGNGNTATVVITIGSVNDAPSVTNQNVTTTEDTSVSFAPLAGDIEGNTLTFTILTAPTNGIATVNAGNLVYTPSANYNGTDSFEYQAHDSNGGDSTARVFVTVQPVNDEPLANAQNITLAEDNSRSIELTGSDVEGDALSFTIVSGPTHGALSGTAPNVVYTPAGNYNGSDSFTFRINDGTTDSAIVSVSLTVTAVNDAPVANAQSVTLAEDGSRSIELTGSDVDGDALSFAIVSGPAHGALSGTAPNLTYTPVANYNGSDSFTFRVNDGTTDSAIASVSITVTAVNDAPAANAQSVTLGEDGSRSIELTSSDVDGDALSFAVVSGPTHGSLSGTAPNLIYTPTANYNGSDSFTFRVNDGTADSATASVSINVTAVNDAPVANAQSVTLGEDGSRSIEITGSDVDGDALSFAIVSGPTHGSLSGTAPNLTYTPAANYNGSDSFAFRVNDGTTNSAAASMSITVTAVNDAPVANNGSRTLAEDTSAAITLTASDVDGDALTFSIVSAPLHGTLSGTGANRTYTPAANYNGPDSFTFVVNDGTTNSTAATVNITVTPVNDAPSLLGYSTAIAEETPITFTLTVSDLDNDPLTYIIVTGPSNGTLSGTGPMFTYTPGVNFLGTETMIIKASDGIATSGNAYVNFTVYNVNDAPIASPQTVSVNEDTPKVITLVGSDADGNSLLYTLRSNPAHGTISGAALNISSTNANLTYTPAANYNGPDSFTFSVHDGSTNSIIATVTINVAAVNDAPVANAQSVTVIYNTAKSITLTGSDSEGSALTYSIVTTPTNGTLSGTGPNVTYTPTVGSAGADRFTFRVNDGGSNSAPTTVNITTLNPVAISPAPSSLAVTVPTAQGTLVLNWSCTATNEDGFKIERSLNGSSGWSQIATTGINIHTYTNTGLANNTRYYYRVRSYNRLGNSSYSNTANNKTRP